METASLYEAVEGSLETWLASIHMAAAQVLARHWEEVKLGEADKEAWKDRSTLQPSLHRKGNHIQIKWIATEWFGRGATRRVVKTSIPKTLEYGYTPAALKKYARDWEWPIVEATEKELASLRKQAAYLVKAKMAIRQANKALLQIDGEDESEEG